MRYIKLIIALTAIALLDSCSSMNHEHKNLHSGRALPGTETVVVGIAVDKKGVPKETFKNVIVYPGQNVIYAGPENFAIVFKNRKTPNSIVENKSVNGVVSIKVPEDILDKKEFVEEFRSKKSLTFDYSISINGKELDPPMIVIPR